MSIGNSYQNALIEALKAKIPSSTSLVDEIAETLNLSSDSAYRRIRGETFLTFQEAALLCKKFDISLDALVGNSTYSVTFDYFPIDNERLTISRFLEMMEEDFDEAKEVNQVELIYLARDMPVFYLFMLPEICAFKVYFWNLLYQDPSHKAEKFHLDSIGSKQIKQCNSIWRKFMEVPSIEIWGVPTFDAILDEIDFLWESSLFESKEVALLICDKVSELLMQVKKQAESGYKFANGQEPSVKENNLQLYYTDFQLTHNKIMIHGDINRIYISQALDTIITTNPVFYNRNYDSIKNILKRSTLISKVGEKERNKFVTRCQKKIDRLKKKIEMAEE